MRQTNEIEDLNKYFSMFLNVMKNQSSAKSALEGFVSGELQEFGGLSSHIDLNKN